MTTHPTRPSSALVLRSATWSAIALSLALGMHSAWAQTTAAAPVASSPARASVGVARLDSVWVQPEREAPASVVARNVSRLSAETAGTLLRWTADVGAAVKRGEVLAQIDPRDAELSVQRAQAALDASNARLKLAQAQLQRSRDLVAQGFYSQEALAQRETEVALLQTEASANRAQLATAQRQLGKTTLRAPFDASVTERLAQTGEAVASGSALYVLTDSGPAELAHGFRGQPPLPVGAAVQEALVRQGALQLGQGARVDCGLVAELTGQRVEVDVLHGGPGVAL